MSTATPPITQRDVARACGVHPSTICLALNHARSIPEETRRRIQAVASQLGYTPNVGARNLALLRTEKKAAGNLPIAWLNQEARRDHWRVDAEARGQFDAARREAEELGYHLEEIWTREPGMNATRLVQIVRARGIAGVIFPVHRSFDFSLLSPAWGEFATVGLNDLRLGEWIDVVSADYHANAEAVLRRLRGRGVEAGRVGLVLSTQFDAASSGLVHGGFLRYQADLAPAERVPVCFVAEDAWDPEAKAAVFREWFREHRPEVIVGRDAALPAWARSEGVAVDAEWVQLNAAAGDFVVAVAVDEGAAEIAAAAVRCVVEKIRRFETGIGSATRVQALRGTLTGGPAGAGLRRETETVVA